MGLLDDAIREHLELKRRHGADPRRSRARSSEALGPARRTAETAPAARGGARGRATSLSPTSISSPSPSPCHEAEPEPEPEPEPSRAEPEPVARSVESTIDQPTVEHPAAKPEPARGRAEDAVLGDDAAQSDASSETENEDDDVLEGTPEFLEETPEHDRLWFEQRPPRDFDFDD